MHVGVLLLRLGGLPAVVRFETMSLCSALEKCVQGLLQARTGLSEEAPQLVELRSGCDLVVPAASNATCDRFRLLIPFAGATLTWEMLYNAAEPDFPPDFIFGEPSFNPPIDRLPHVHGWRIADDGAAALDSLTLAIRDLLAEYKAYQVALLGAHAPRLGAEYMRLCRALRRRCRGGLQQQQPPLADVTGRTASPLPISSDEDNELREDEDAELQQLEGRALPNSSSAHRGGAPDVEVLAAPLAQGKDGPVVFLAKLRVSGDVAAQASLVRDGTVGDLSALLKLTYKSASSASARTTAQLTLSSAMQRLLNDTVRLPAFGSATRLDEYATAVGDLLDEKVKGVCGEFSRKVEFVLNLVDAFEGAVVEYDSENYSKVTMLMDYLDFHFLAFVDVPESFPAEPPSISFRSIYHTDGEAGEPFMKHLRRCPWSPRWVVTEMVTRLRAFLQESVGTFQRLSVTQGSSLHAAASTAWAPSAALSASGSSGNSNL